METSAITINPNFSAMVSNQFTTLVEQWLSLADITDASRAAYRRNVRDFQRWCIETGVQRLNRETLLLYKKKIRTLTAATQANYLASLRQFFRYLERATGFPDPTAKAAFQSDRLGQRTST